MWILIWWKEPNDELRDFLETIYSIGIFWSSPITHLQFSFRHRKSTPQPNIKSASTRHNLSSPTAPLLSFYLNSCVAIHVACGAGISSKGLN